MNPIFYLDSLSSDLLFLFWVSVGGVFVVGGIVKAVQRRKKIR